MNRTIHQWREQFDDLAHQLGQVSDEHKDEVRRSALEPLAEVALGLSDGSLSLLELLKVRESFKRLAYAVQEARNG